MAARGLNSGLNSGLRPQDASVPRLPGAGRSQTELFHHATQGTASPFSSHTPGNFVQTVSSTDGGYQSEDVRVQAAGLLVLEATATSADELFIPTTDSGEPPISASQRSSGAAQFPDPLPRKDPNNSQQITAQSGFSLDQAIAMTLANDPVLRGGMQEIQQAYAEQVTASLKPNPEVEIIQSLLPLGRPFNEFDRQGGPPQFDFGYSYPIDWYLFGKRAAAMQATLQGRMATELEFADLVRQRVLLTAISFFDALEQQALIELAEQDVENLLAVEKITKTAVDNGAMPRVDYSRIRLDRLNSEQTLRETRRDLAAAKASLLVAMGLESTPIDFELAGELPEPLEDRFPELESLFNLAQSNRPDIAALRSRINEARANMNVEYREAFPEVTPMMGYTRQFQERAIGFPSVSSWGVGLSMTLPIHNRNQGNRIRATSERMQRMEQLRAGLVELRGELSEVLAELEAARINAISTAEEQLVLAAEVRDSIREAYQVGDRPLIDVLDSQRNFRETYRNFINSRADYWRAIQRYQAALANQ
jgi:cobalt-zinc-cadmium efflux system outer membrane protein